MTELAPGARLGELTILRRVPAPLDGAVYAATLGPERTSCRVRVTPDGLVAGRDDESELERALRAPERVGAPLFPSRMASGVERETGRGWAATRWIAGSAVGDVVQARGRLPLDEARAILGAIGAGLVAAARAGEAHGALQPELVMLVPDGAGLPSVQVLDLGSASWIRRRVRALPPDDDGVPRGYRPATAWRSPEWLRELAPDAAADDVWGFALLAHLVLAGRPFFAPRADDPPSAMRLAVEITAGPYPRASERVAHRARLPEGFDAWLARLLVPAPDRPILDDALITLDRLLEAERDATTRRTVAAPSPPPSSPAADLEEITREGWRALADAHPGAITLGDGELASGGVVWTLPYGITVAAARAFVDRARAIAQLVADAPRLATVGWTGRLLGRGVSYPSLLAELGLAAPREREEEPGGTRATIDDTGLTLFAVEETWVTSHTVGAVARAYVRVPRAELPSRREEAKALVERLVAAAPLVVARPARTCRFCGRTLPPLHMHDRETCQRCAEEHLGVIH